MVLTPSNLPQVQQAQAIHALGAAPWSGGGNAAKEDSNKQWNLPGTVDLSAPFPWALEDFQKGSEATFQQSKGNCTPA